MAPPDIAISPSARKTRRPSHAGARLYSRPLLAVYDLIVYRFNLPLLWRCPVGRVRDLYDTHVTDNHLDIGVGTGYFLDRCRFPGPRPRIALLDLNPNSLRHTAHRIERHRPEQHLQDVLEPFCHSLAPVDSVGLSLTLHCLPGTMAEKAVAFDHIRAVMRPGAVFFGVAVLGDGVTAHGVARMAMWRMNAWGFFSNEEDSPSSLERELRARFVDVEVEIVGCAALFSARTPSTARFSSSWGHRASSRWKAPGR